MHLTVNGKQLDVGDALRQHVADSLSAAVAKYFSNPIEANVVISRDAHLYRADVFVHVGRGIVARSDGESEHPYQAFDAACEKVAKRLRRYKRRLRDHHNRSNGEIPNITASHYTLDAQAEEPDTDEAIEGQVNGTEHQPVVIAEMTTEIVSLTVSEAVMRMELADVPALMFRNRAHGGLNMVYRRPDGNVGWVDPRGSGSPA